MSLDQRGRSHLLVSLSEPQRARTLSVGTVVFVLALVEVFVVVTMICGGLYLFVHVLTEWSGRPRRRGRGWLGSSDQTWSAGDYGSGDGGGAGGSDSGSGSSCGGGSSSSCGGGS